MLTRVLGSMHLACIRAGCLLTSRAEIVSIPVSCLWLVSNRLMSLVIAILKLDLTALLAMLVVLVVLVKQ